MKRSLRVLVTVLLCIALLQGAASAAVKINRLTGYALIVNGQEIKLSEKTGYLFRYGSTLMAPVVTASRAMGLTATADRARRMVTIDTAHGGQAILQARSKTMSLDGKSLQLRVPTGQQDEDILTADVLFLKQLGASMRHYKPSAALRKLGYNAGALVIDSTGGTNLTLPSREKPSSVLPEIAREAAKTANQIVTVIPNTRTTATLAFYVKDSKGVWSRQFSAPALLGRNGVGKTKEGDGKTPVGTYNLTTPFGNDPDPGAKMPYTRVKPTHYWCSTSGSPYYNQLVDTAVQTDYKPSDSDEHLSTYVKAYQYALFIDYNAKGVKGKGSAIFLHCLTGSDSTAGCVMTNANVLLKLVRTLEPGAKIVIGPLR